MARSPLLVFLARFGTLALIYSVLRALFVLLNRDTFPAVPAMAFIGGMRFDLSALAWLNLPWVLLFLVKPDARGWFGTTQKVVFHTVNIAGFFFNCVDLEYYHFTLKRSTADLFRIASTGNDTAHLAPAFIRDYWWVLIIFLGCIALAEIGYRCAGRFNPTVALKPVRKVIWRAVVIMIVVFASRGGVQVLPLGVLHAGNYAPPACFPVVLNTPFTIMMSIGKPVIEEQQYMAQEEAERLWPVKHNYGDTAHIATRPNVVVIILESFSAAYSARLSGEEGYMPFLDSLMGQGMNFDHAYANGRRSIDGIPAVIASIPEMMDEAFLVSPYAQTPFTSLANTLVPMGYTSSFFHGGRNGTMGFDVFAKSAGFQRYVGQDEYPGGTDYDGHWGIWDRPFLQYWAQELNKEQQPFLSCLFTLSSHHPYELLPEDMERFPSGRLPIHRTLRYTDDAMRQFFATARTMPWYANTLFVITADHTADIERNGQHYSQATDYWVPLLYYMPGAIAPLNVPRVTQQIDILPTILDLIGYDRPFFSFGASALRSERMPCSIGASTGTYLIIDSTGGQSFPHDRLANGVIHDQRDADHQREQTLRAAVQQFNGHLLRHDLVVQP